ncbi:methionine synthase reductase-like [Ornithodoros turicata]|uniref:methionine synthase reductase-like n=1 Tax=Ornithodoros turicata TaxID=34597 RepID=UPI00313A2ED3
MSCRGTSTLLDSGTTLSPSSFVFKRACCLQPKLRSPAANLPDFARDLLIMWNDVFARTSDRIRKLFEPHCNSSAFQCTLDDTVDIQYPALPPSSLRLKFCEDVSPSDCDRPWQNGQPLPFAASGVFEAELTSARRLTNSKAVKDTWELEFCSVPSKKSDAQSVPAPISYMPGDAFGFLCPNSEKEVDELLEHVECGKERKRTPCIVNFLKPEKAAKQFGHLPSGQTTLADLFGTCCDIRGVLKKVFLRVLAEHTQNEDEKRLLLFLSSRQGAQVYTQVVLAQKMTIVDLLTIFLSCNPPEELVLEHLQRLQPRFYSASSWSQESAGKGVLRIIYKRVVFPEQPCRSATREGLCTSWLTKLAVDWIERNQKGVDERLERLSLDDKKCTVQVYLRKNISFQFPRELDAKLVMVGPGSGLAPFLCYLQWKEHELNERSSDDPSLVTKIAESWLFFGCRYRDLDFLYREELDRLLKKGVLSRLFVAFSRDARNGEESDSARPKYVQDSLRQHKEDVSELIVKGGARVFVCGDAKNMANEVRTAFCEALRNSGTLGSAEEAESYVKTMQKEGRYMQDVWA